MINKRFEIESDLRLVVTNYLDGSEGLPSDDPNVGVYISCADHDKHINWENGTVIWVDGPDLVELIKCLKEFVK